MTIHHDHEPYTDPRVAARNAALEEEVKPDTGWSKLKKRVLIGVGVTAAGAALAGGIAVGTSSNSEAKGPAAGTGTEQSYNPSTVETTTTTPEVTEETVVYNDNGVERHGIVEYAMAHQLVTAESGAEGRVFTAATNDDEVHQMLGIHFADLSSVINLRTGLSEEQDKEFVELAVDGTVLGEGARDSEMASMIEADRELNKEKPGSVTYKVEKIDHQGYKADAIAGGVIFERIGPDGQSQRMMYNVALNLVSGAWKAEYAEVGPLQ